MAAVTPVPGNGCKGTFKDGTSNIQHKCLKGLDQQSQKYLPVRQCVCSA